MAGSFECVSSWARRAVKGADETVMVLLEQDVCFLRGSLGAASPENDA